MAKAKLLLADDSVTIQKVVNLTFADEDIEVITAASGDEAMRLIADSRPDVVLADVNMPGLNGYQVCEQLRAGDETKNLPVMLLVGSFEPFDEELSSRVGANSVMTKPFVSIRALVNKVSEMIESASADTAAGENAATAEPYTIEPADKAKPTSDIDDLYNQSLTETAPTAADDRREQFYNSDTINDDEMIETTYVEKEAEHGQSANYVSPFDAAVTDTAHPGEQTDNPLATDVDTSVIAENVPAHDSPKSDEPRSEPVGIDHLQAERNYFQDDSDLLELPDQRPADADSSNKQPTTAANQLSTLSPELIDEIVQKVIERLAATRGE